MPVIPSRSLYRLTTQPGRWAFPAHFLAGRRVGGYRYISVQATPSTDSTTIDVVGKSTAASTPDASFEILGSPYSLLSATLSPSQDLFTRRGSLVGLSSSQSPDDVISTLRLLSPLRRLPLGIPFLYQRITSTTPISLLISTPSTSTSFCILQLDGTTDWKLTQRKALLAWTGKTMRIAPTISASLSLAHWGATNVEGRGLLALSGVGNTYSVSLAAGESFVAHPSQVLAYSTSSPTASPPPPTPYRFKSSTVKLSIPLSLGNWFPSSKFIMALKDSNTYKFFSNALLRIRTWSRRTIWGDRLFLRFEGPTTILIQSRASRVRDVLTRDEVNEIADAPAGVVSDTVRNLTGGVGAQKIESKRMGVEGAMSGAAQSPIDMYNSAGMGGQPMQARPAAAQAAPGEKYALQDYQIQSLLLEEQNRKRKMAARQEQEKVVSRDGAPVSEGVGVDGTAPSAGSGAGQSQPKLQVASVSGDGKVTFEAKKEP